jgi:hypothetical protein
MRLFYLTLNQYNRRRQRIPMPLICYKNVWFDSLATKNEVVIGMCLQFIFVYVGMHRLRRIALR